MFYRRKNHKKTEIICTICSREKNENPNPMPAIERYLGPHVRQAHSVALRERRPFFILSGRYGLITAERHVRHYDYRLEQGAIEKLAERVAWQIGVHGIRTIRYYMEPKDSWAPYSQVLYRAQELSQTGLIQQVLSYDTIKVIMPFKKWLLGVPETA